MWRMFRFLFLGAESFLSVAGIGMAGQFLVIVALSAIEKKAGRPGPFDLYIPCLSDMPLWVGLVSCSAIFLGFVFARNGGLQLGIRHSRGSAQARFDVPSARVAASFLALWGATVAVFYCLRQLLVF